jgi:NADH:ubiquinone oxidoreductase subunit 6 (subunit J)
VTLYIKNKQAPKFASIRTQTRFLSFYPVSIFFDTIFVISFVSVLDHKNLTFDLLGLAFTMLYTAHIYKIIWFAIGIRLSVV